MSSVPEDYFVVVLVEDDESADRAAANLAAAGATEVRVGTNLAGQRSVVAVVHCAPVG